jgi:K+-sensing histidine kinase KdpD
VGRLQSQNLSPQDPLAQLAQELLDTSDESLMIGFPLHTAGKTFGMLGILLSPKHELGLEEKGIIQQFTDVAALCLQNAQLFEAQARQARELQHEDELRRSFLSYITHELRTPLASLKTSFELVQESEKIQELDEPYQRLLTNINRSVTTLEQLINNFAEVANLSSGGVVLNKTLTSPETILYQVVDITTPFSHLEKPEPGSGNRAGSASAYGRRPTAGAGVDQYCIQCSQVYPSRRRHPGCGFSGKRLNKICSVR